jgi:regulator of sigma E protease
MLATVSMIVTFLFVFSFIVFIHEYGHYKVARYFGVKVFEFSIGFGPKLFKFKRNSTLYSLGIIPLGGFVKIAGLDDDEENSYEANESFLNKTVLQRMLIIVAGPLMNVAMAILIFTVIFSVIGVPGEEISNKVDTVYKNMPAYEAGIKVGDNIIKVNDYDVVDMSKAVSIIHNSNGENLKITIKRKDEIKQLNIKGEQNKTQDEYYIGIRLASKNNIRYNPFVAAFLGVKNTYAISKRVVFFVGKFFVGQVPLKEVSGVVVVAKTTSDYAQKGLSSFLFFVAFLNVNLGIINLVPFPALDGSRVLFLLVEGLFGRKNYLSKVEDNIHYVGFVFLIMFMILITYKDIIKVIN